MTITYVGMVEGYEADPASLVLTDWIAAQEHDKIVAFVVWQGADALVDVNDSSGSEYVALGGETYGDELHIRAFMALNARDTGVYQVEAYLGGTRPHAGVVALVFRSTVPVSMDGVGAGSAGGDSTTVASAQFDLLHPGVVAVGEASMTSDAAGVTIAGSISGAYTNVGTTAQKFDAGYFLTTGDIDGEVVVVTSPTISTGRIVLAVRLSEPGGSGNAASVVEYF